MPSLKSLTSAINRFENPKTPFLNIIFTFIGVITLRNFLEQFSTKNPISLILGIHYSVFYIALALSLIILFHWATKESVEKIARIILPCFIILSLVPIADLLLSMGQGYNITYLRPGVHHHLLKGFLLFLCPFHGQGVSPGQQIEIALVILMSALYFFIKTGRPLRSIFFALLTYALIFFYLALPFILRMLLNILEIPYDDSNELMVQLYLLLILPLSQALFYLYKKEYFIAIWKDSRPLRIAHFLAMAVLGLAFSLNPAVKALFIPAVRQSGVLLSWFFIPPAIIFGWLYSVMVNNCEDYDIDKISNKNRPTVSRTIPLGHYKNISYLFLVLALIYAVAVNFLCFFIMLLWISNYFLYSSPPFRLKKIPFFSKLVVSLNSLLLFALGYSLCEDTLIPPSMITIFFLTCFTAVINFIDIKDYEGDKSAGIKTLPTLWGLRQAKLVIGSFFIITYGLTPFIIGDLRLFPVMAAIGILICWLINRKNYSEKPIFITYLLSIILLIVYFLIH